MIKKGFLMKLYKLFPTFLLIVLIFSFCTKNLVNTGNDEEGERILFIRSSREFSEICTMKPDGSDIKVIKHHNNSDDVYYPEGYMFARWSPDKSKIVVQGGPGSTLEYWPLWLMDMESNLLYRLTWNGWNPLWKNDTEIIYQRVGWVGGGFNLYSVNIVTLEERLIFAQEESLSIRLNDISNDGEYTLGYLSRATTDSSGNLEWERSIAQFEIDSLKNYKILVTNNNLSASILPKWSPDEDLISYALLDESYVRNMYLMTAEGDSLYRLTNETNTNPYAFMFYDWSPDGQKLAYSKPNQGEEWNHYTDVIITDIQTKSVKNITNTAQDSILNYVMDWK